MKNILQVVTFILVVTTLVFSQGTTITILHVNDSHSHLDAVGPKDANLHGTLGGIAKAATVIGQVRATQSNVLLLHAGDAFVGDPIFNTYFGYPELVMMKQLGFDAMTVGNHEFDLGPDVLYGSLAAAFADGSFPILSANLNMDAYPSLKTWITPSMMKEIGGVKVGIFGLTVPNNPTNNPAPVIVEEDVFTIAGQTITDLRSNGAQVVICLSHLGIYLDKLLASNVPGIDIIVGGHDHYVFNQPVSVVNPLGQNTLIVQAGEHYKYVGEMKFTVDNGKITINDYKMIPVDKFVPAEPTVQAAVDQFKLGVINQFGDLYGKVISFAPQELSKNFDPDSPLRDTPLGNLVTDAFRAKTHTQLSITALGLISEKIYKGAVTGADVFRSMSYGYDPATKYGLTLATFDIQGSELVKGMEIGLTHLEMGDDFFLQYSGLRFKYDISKPEGQRVIVPSIHIGEKKFDPNAIYSVTVDLGIAVLLPSMGVTVQNLQILPDFEYVVVRDFIAQRRVICYQSEGRIREEKAAAASHRADERSGEREHALHGNYPNPFNPSTTISYGLTTPERVTVSVYNALGQKVASFDEGWKQAGEYTIRWDAGNMSSGVYFYRLSAGKINETRKMFLLK
jgi:5'-nucleotidase/UDP-sugar diphosphatase